MLGRVGSSLCSLGSLGDGFDLRGCLGYCVGPDSGGKLSSTSLKKRGLRISRTAIQSACAQDSRKIRSYFQRLKQVCSTYAHWQRSVTHMKLVSGIRKQTLPCQDAWLVPSQPQRLHHPTTTTTFCGVRGLDTDEIQPVCLSSQAFLQSYIRKECYMPEDTQLGLLLHR